MNRNIELKTRFDNLDRAAQILGSLGASEQPPMRQTDTYFFSVRGRLKLRQFDLGREAELIWYTREDARHIRPSDYLVMKIGDAAGLKIALSAANGIRGVVKKRRRWFLWENVRIHLDDVEDLGKFIEFEAVSTGSDTEQSDRDIITMLCEKLGIDPADYIEPSYIDLMGL